MFVGQWPVDQVQRATVGYHPRMEEDPPLAQRRVETSTAIVGAADPESFAERRVPGFPGQDR
jgi:hypothetical protein